MKFSALRPVRHGTKSLTVKIPDALHARLVALKSSARSAGFRVDVDEAAAQVIGRLVDQAERELERVAAESAAATSDPDVAGEASGRR